MIVPIYNTEQYLTACLESLAAQTLTGVEIILVNDGSTDGSLAVAKRFASGHSNFTVYSTENKGVSHARNYGAERSHGDYLVFVDSDDEVEPDFCEVMYEKAMRDGNDLVICRIETIKFQKGALVRVPQKHEFFEMDNYRLEDYPHLLTHISSGSWNKLVRRDLFHELKFPEDVHYREDFFFSLKAFCLAKRIGTVKQVLYHYYKIHAGVSFRFGSSHMDWLICMEYIFDFMQTMHLIDVYRDQFEYWIVGSCIGAWRIALNKNDRFWLDRVRYVQGMYKFLNCHFPSWRKNNYHLKRVKQRNCVDPYYDYGEGHLLLLIILSRILPNEVYKSIRWMDWRLYVRRKRALNW